MRSRSGTENRDVLGSRTKSEAPPRREPRLGARAVEPPAAEGAGAPEPHAPAEEASLRPRRLAWADLLRRVFAIDVLECPRCGARTRLLAAIHPPDATSAILECLELPARAPPLEAARGDDGEPDPWKIPRTVARLSREVAELSR